MVTIKKNGATLQLEQGTSLFHAQDTSDGLYIKTQAGDEFIIQRGSLPEAVIRTVVTSIQQAKAKNIVVDFNNPRNPISFSN